MEIRIKALRLRNFKGTREAEYVFDGRNARIEGPNGSGKSTVFDAFTWLLFGKDHKNQTTFEIKTLDPETGRAIPRVEHWVEAELVVDGRNTVLRRAWNEKWVKPTGAAEEVMQGHTSLFFVDGVDVGTKTAYDTMVAGLINEAQFKLLTNPLFFIDDAYTDWKSRRKALLALVQDAPERARVQEEFRDVIDQLSGRSLEDFRKMIGQHKRANKQDLDTANAMLAGMRDTLPEAEDVEAIKGMVEDLRKRGADVVAALNRKAAKIDEALADAGKQDEARQAENRAIWAEITKVQLRMGELTAAAKKVAQEGNAARAQELAEWKQRISRAQHTIDAANDEISRDQRTLARLQAERGKAATDLKGLGDSYNIEKGRAFEYVPQTTCPCCGQELSAATREQAEAQAHEAFMAQRKEAIDIILSKARTVKEDIGRLDAQIKQAQDNQAKWEQERETARAEQEKCRAEVLRIGAVPEADLEAAEAAAKGSDAYKELAARERELRSKALGTGGRPEGTEELVKQRQAIYDQVKDELDKVQEAEKPLNDRLARQAVRAEQLERIERKENERRHYADELARLERLELRLAEYAKADIDSVEGPLNALFRVARWKMFDRTIDGGLVEMCEVCDADGTPYRSMNDAMKTLCGMDVIRVFGERYGSQAPIFIDNAEGILRERFDTPAQVIRLVVKDAQKLTLTTEE